MEFIVQFLLGLFVIVVGISNIRGNISSIHWYNRQKITAANAPRYGKLVGLGTIIIGISIIISSLLCFIFSTAFFYFIDIFGFGIGIALILYAQFKFNKGLF